MNTDRRIFAALLDMHNTICIIEGILQNVIDCRDQRLVDCREMLNANSKNIESLKKLLNGV